MNEREKSTTAAFRAAVVAGMEAEGGRNSDVYPLLLLASPELFAAALHPIVGTPLSAGDSEVEFILMSVAKPFVLALAADAHGESAVLALTGMHPTGLAFNDPLAVTACPDGRTNPMVNPGAISVASLMGGGDVAAGEAAILSGLSAFAGRELAADPDMVAAIHAANSRNRLLAGLLAERGLLAIPPEDALRLYTLQSCVAVTARDLARMGAVLANGGRDPVSGVRVVSASAAVFAVEAMGLAGMYEATDVWMQVTGFPAKSGIAGALVMVVPGWGAFGSYSPPLDGTGNPVRAQAAAKTFARLIAPSTGSP